MYQLNKRLRLIYVNVSKNRALSLFLFLVLFYLSVCIVWLKVNLPIILQVRQMSLPEKVGQLFMIGNLSEKPISEELFTTYHMGNFFLGYTDINELTPKQVAEITNKLQKLSEKYNQGIPLLIATDQEGGKVNRLKGVVLYPDQEYVGSKLNPTLAKEIGSSIAQQLLAVGINVNFSPVVDMNTNPKNHIAKKKRSFGSDPVKVAEFGLSYLEGYRQEGLIGCIKHFPGYGDEILDPHKEIVISTRTYEQIKKCELIPYSKGIEQGLVDMVMTAHIGMPEINGGKSTPATVSLKIIQGILRGDLKYKGVVVTDDFYMGAMGSKGKKHYEKLLVRCINAGVDIILLVGNKTLAVSSWKAIYNAVKNGEIEEKRIEKSVKRILKLKYKYKLFKKRYVDLEKVGTCINTARQKELLAEIK